MCRTHTIWCLDIPSSRYVVGELLTDSSLLPWKVPDINVQVYSFLLLGSASVSRNNKPAVLPRESSAFEWICAFLKKRKLQTSLLETWILGISGWGFQSECHSPPYAVALMKKMLNVIFKGGEHHFGVETPHVKGRCAFSVWYVPAMSKMREKTLIYDGIQPH